MYIPKHNEETRIDVIDRLIRSHPLATLVTMGASGLFATHLPMVLYREGEQAILRGHISRANRQWREFTPEVEALAIFSGPEHYITPNWYPEKAVTGKVVPTWNYAVVHAYGTMRVMDDEAWLRTQIGDLTRSNEAARATPWAVTDAPKPFVDAMVRGIIGLEIEIARIEGKWKVSQNRPAEDRAGVAAGLRRGDDPMQRAMAELVDRARRQE